MKKYKGTLRLINISANNEEEAKEEFWRMAIEDKASLEVEIEDITLEDDK